VGVSCNGGSKRERLSESSIQHWVRRRPVLLHENKHFNLDNQPQISSANLHGRWLRCRGGARRIDVSLTEESFNNFQPSPCMPNLQALGVLLRHIPQYIGTIRAFNGPSDQFWRTLDH
jgi:hypothetical protein